MSRSLAVLSLTIAVISCALAPEDAEARGRRCRHRHRCCVNDCHSHACCDSGYHNSGYLNNGCCGEGGCQITNNGYVTAPGQVGYSGSNTSYYRGNPTDQNPRNLNRDVNQDPNREIRGRVESSVGTQNNIRVETSDDAADSTTRANAQTDDSTPPLPTETNDSPPADLPADDAPPAENTPPAEDAPPAPEK